jgi:hypothetical protein
VQLPGSFACKKRALNPLICLQCSREFSGADADTRPEIEPPSPSVLGIDKATFHDGGAGRPGAMENPFKDISLSCPPSSRLSKSHFQTRRLIDFMRSNCAIIRSQNHLSTSSI